MACPNVIDYLVADELYQFCHLYHTDAFRKRGGQDDLSRGRNG
jgi:hypothetical protein